MRKPRFAAALFASAAFTAPVFAASVTAQAETTLEKVRAQGFVQCASVPRPGLAVDAGNGEWKGLEVEMCRAVATAALGPKARVAFHALGSDKDFDSVRAGADQLVFLTYTEMQAQGLTDKLLPGPAIFLESHKVMVAAALPAKSVQDLGGISVCSLAGTPADASIEGYAAEHAIPVQHRPYSEDGEMFDAFRVQSCKAIADETTNLARERLDGGVNHLAMRILPEPLHTFPVVAATPLTDDARWGAIVAWTMHTLVAADSAETTYHAGGLASTPVAAAGLGLSDGWQKAVVDNVGSYSAIFRRTLGADSALALEQGPNAAAPQGALAAPNAD